MQRIFKSSITTYILILTISAAFLFVIKHKVSMQRKELNEITTEILNEKENIHVLKAEYTYLSNPNRIKNLVTKHLNLKVVNPEQVIDSAKVQAHIKPPKSADVEEK